MIEVIIDLIKSHTCIIHGKPSGLTHKYLNKVYDSRISNLEYPNSVPKLGTLLSPYYDREEIISGDNARGEFIVYHVDTYNKLKEVVK